MWDQVRDGLPSLVLPPPIPGKGVGQTVNYYIAH